MKRGEARKHVRIVQNRFKTKQSNVTIVASILTLALVPELHMGRYVGGMSISPR